MQQAPMDFYAELTNQLKIREQNNLRRTLNTPDGIDLSSNDYLGFAQHPELIEAIAEGARHYGASSAASRLLRGHTELHTQSERVLASFSGRESALLFSSGFAANVGIIPALTSAHDTIFTDSLNHASLIDGMRLSRATRVVYPHNDLATLEKHLSRPCTGRKFIITESLFSMDGDFADLEKLTHLAQQHDALLMVDEAHTTGIYGHRGSGRVEELGIQSHVICTMHTGSKALGIGGAWVAGDQVLIDYLINTARSFIYSTAPMPGLTAGLAKAVMLRQENPEIAATLLGKAHFVRQALIERGIDIMNSQSQIIPILLKSSSRTMQIAQALQHEGYDVRAIRPPTVPTGTARLRLSIHSHIPNNTLSAFVERLCYHVETTS